MSQPPVDFGFVVMPKRFSIVMSCQILQDTADIGIMRRYLPRPASILFCQLMFLSTPLTKRARGYAALVADTDNEARSDVLGSNAFHRFGDRKTRLEGIVRLNRLELKSKVS